MEKMKYLCVDYWYIVQQLKDDILTVTKKGLFIAYQKQRPNVQSRSWILSFSVRLSGHWLSDKCLAIFALHGFPSFVLIFSYTSQQVSNLSATFEFRDKFLGVQSENCCLKQSLLKCKTDNWSLKRLGFQLSSGPLPVRHA